MSEAVDRLPLDRRGAPDHRYRVLVVDRDEGILAFAAEVLNSFRPGFEVATAASNDHAVQWLETFTPDILLLGEDGDGAARLLDDPRTRQCKVVMLLDDPPAGLRRQPLRARAHMVLPKPPGLQALLQAVRTLT